MGSGAGQTGSEVAGAGRPPQLGARFAKLWAANTASALGSGLTIIAAPLFVASRTSDPLIVSATSAVAWLPWLLFALPGGVVVDRVDRRRLMLLIDWVRVATLALLTVAMMAGRAGIGLLLAVLFVVNTGEIVFRAAAQALLPSVVPRALLERANGWLGGGATLTQGMIAGPLGGLLFLVATTLPFAVNGLTYAVSALLIGAVGGTYRASADRGDAGDGGDGRATGSPGLRGIATDVVEGFRWLAGQRLLRTMAGLIGLLNITLTAAIAVLVLLARERLHLGSVGYGLLFTCMALGGLAGSVVGDRLIVRFTATWTIRIGLLIEAATHLALAASRSAWLIGVVLFAFGVHGALWGIVGSSLRQRLTPPQLLGRVGSTILFVAAGGNCVGALLGGLLAASFGLTAPYWVGFVAAVGVSLATWRVFDRETVAAAYRH